VATKPRPARKAKPFTLAHFKAWASTVTLDTGRPWELEPFQARFIDDVFQGTPECWLVIPEGNGKTTLVAGLALYHCQHTVAAEVPVAASSRDQAEILFRQAEGFIIRTPWMQTVFKRLPGFRRILYEPDGISRLQVFAADDRTGDGVIPTLCVVDELHRHRDLKLYRTWVGKLPKRRGQVVTISTAGEPGGEFEETRRQIRESADSTTRTRTFVRARSKNLVLHEWAVPEDGDVHDLKLVKRANPFSGVTVEILQRKKNSPTMTDGHWRRLNCNQPTRSDRAAIQEAEWEKAATVDIIPEGEAVWVGLDLSWKWDSTAVVPLWIHDKTYRLFGPAQVFTPPRDGTSLDPNVVQLALLAIHERNPVHTVVMNVNGAQHIAAWVAETLHATVVDRVQSLPLSALDYERFMEGLRNGWIKHSGDRALTRHALNAVARILPSGQARFEPHSRSVEGGDQEQRVIDALVAAASVHTVALAELDKPEPAMPLAAWR
jgi:hypothetical protein